MSPTLHETIKVGIIGTGRHGVRYVNHLIHDVAGLSLVAVSRRSCKIGSTQAREWNARYYENWRHLVADPHVDAVIATTTPNLHIAIAEECVQHGKPLLVEKPFALSVDEAQRIVALFARHSLPVTVGQTLRYNATIRALRRELSRVGELYFFSANQRLERTLHPWLDDPDVAGGGVIFHSAVHLFDAIRYITGLEVRRVTAQVLCRHTHRLEDQFSAMFEMDGAVQGGVDASKIGPARTGRYEFVGEKGQLLGDQVHNFVQFVEGVTVSSLPLGDAVATIVPLLEQWRDFLLGRGPNPIPGEEGLAAIRICEACRQSAREQRWITL